MGVFETRPVCLLVPLTSFIFQWFLLLTPVTEVQMLTEHLEYPPQVNVEKLLSNLSDHWQTSPSEDTPAALQKNGVTLPYIDTRDYLSWLAQWSSLSVIKSAIIVVGPISSGKSEGLKQIKPFWQKLGHVVLDIDLKGKKSNISSQDVMWDVANQVTEAFYSFEYQAQQCAFEKLVYDCATNNALHSWWSTSIYSTWSVLYNTILGLLAMLTIDTILAVYTYMKQNWILLLLLLLITPLLVFLSRATNWYAVAGIVLHPVRVGISSGDWYALTCSCNTISNCAPQHRPIMIVRELTNLDSESLKSFLRSLERMKQGDIYYPVFVESSDFLWAHEAPVIKSGDSFIMYHLQEMTHEEGLEELVHKFKIWTEEEYELIYDAIRGHRGSYRLLYDYNKVQKYSLNGSIRQLKRRAYDHVLETVIRGNRTVIEDWMLSLKSNDYIMAVAEIHKEIWVLFKKNILFRDSKYVYPQNKLFEHAINDYISDFLLWNSSITH